MAKHLGRNPFEKKKESGSQRIQPKASAPEEQSQFPKVAEWALIQLPAQSALFAIKTALRIKDFLDRK